jgi:hypothetical protein
MNFIGLGRCSIRKKDNETNSHIFLNCSFSASVWSNIHQDIAPQCRWAWDHIESTFKSWIENSHTKMCKALTLDRILGHMDCPKLVPLQRWIPFSLALCSNQYGYSIYLSPKSGFSLNKPFFGDPNHKIISLGHFLMELLKGILL